MTFRSKLTVVALSVHRRALVLSLGVVLTALVVLSAASGGVNTPYSGWYSGNPLLGPNALNDLACAGETCYASGSGGTVLKSTDGGSTWTGLVTGLTGELTRIHVIADDVNQIVINGGCAVLRSYDGGETFSRLRFLPSGASCPLSVAALSFPSTNVGYLLLSDGNLVSTEDGGRTFSRKTAVPGGTSDSGDQDLLCTTETVCFAATNRGTVQRTTDGGSSWTQVAASGGNLNGLEAVGTTLYAVGNGLTVLKSRDGGSTWDRKPVTGTPPGNLTSIRCGTDDTCLIATFQGNQFLHTTNGGETYRSIAPLSDPMFAIEFASATRALVAGDFGGAAVSDDGGATWRTVGSRIAGPLHLLHAASKTRAYAGGTKGMLARTLDSGRTWTTVSTPTVAEVTGIAAPTTNRLFLLARDGTVQRSDNGGVSYKLVNTGTTSRPRAIAARDADTVLLVGPIGVRRSTDGGETFGAVADKAVRSARLRAVDEAGVGDVVYGAKAAAVSTNAGSAWQRLRLPKGRLIQDLDFVSSRLGFVLDVYGVLWKTATAGAKWEPLLTTGFQGYLVEFADARNGYVAAAGAGRYGWFEARALRTADGGQSWQPQLMAGNKATALESAGGTDYALVGDYALFATQSYGDVGGPRSLSIKTRSRILDKAGPISVSGRLRPAEGGEEVEVAQYTDGDWVRQSARVAANGTFATRWPVRRRAIFVAQVLGDADYAGAGTRSLTVTVKKARKKPVRKH